MISHLEYVMECMGTSIFLPACAGGVGLHSAQDRNRK